MEFIEKSFREEILKKRPRGVAFTDLNRPFIRDSNFARDLEDYERNGCQELFYYFHLMFLKASHCG